jgi:DNA-binding Xre family transcriptional regulator
VVGGGILTKQEVGLLRSAFDKLRRAKAARENREISLRTVAAETGLAFNTLQRVRKASLERVQAATLDKLCRYFRVKSLCDLVEYHPDDKRENGRPAKQDATETG